MIACQELSTEVGTVYRLQSRWILPGRRSIAGLGPGIEEDARALGLPAEDSERSMNGRKSWTCCTRIALWIRRRLRCTPPCWMRGFTIVRFGPCIGF